MYELFVYVGFKMKLFFLDQQRGYTKYYRLTDLVRSFLQSNWPPRSNLKPGDTKILHQPYVHNIIFPTLNIKIGLMKQLVKTLSDYFKHIISKFSNSLKG